MSLNGFPGSNEAIVDSIELATENHLCKRSKTVEEEPNVHALTGVSKRNKNSHN